MIRQVTNSHFSLAPSLIYGTAWKEERTQPLVELALEQGFRAIDTANQRRHYFESAVGNAIQAVISGGLVSRDELFLQSKFTFQRGQDHRLPYDPQAPIETQVRQSFSSSLANLHVGRLDSYLLHAPTQRDCLVADDWAAWRAMESLHDEGKVRFLGISNVMLPQLDQLCQQARIPPAFVQNRCYAVRGWDREVRQYCEKHGIAYQAFSLLTANQAFLARPEIIRLARLFEKSVPQIIFRFALDLGMLPLTGTTSAEHMRADLEIADFSLPQEELVLIESIATSTN
jgi:diketogulonate reductase-like aldo/keto reductase